MSPITAYYFNGACYCVECTQDAAAVGVLVRVPPLQLRVDEHGIAPDARGADGLVAVALHGRVALEACVNCANK
jgi:hypothetical protein